MLTYLTDSLPTATALTAKEQLIELFSEPGSKKNVAKENSLMKRLLATLLTLCLIVGLLPTGALAVPGDGLTAENPKTVPVEGMIINNGTYYGISYDWFKSINSDKQPMYFSIVLPDTVTTILNDGFRDQWSPEKEDAGAATVSGANKSTDWAHYEVVSIDFSGATNLKEIGSQAAMNCSYLSGVLDLSNTKVTTIKKSAFYGCTRLTGVVLPNTLQYLGTLTEMYNDGPAGSVFYGCTGLRFITTSKKYQQLNGNISSFIDFTLPESLKMIGRQTFQNAFDPSLRLSVAIPESVETIGSQAFYNEDRNAMRFEQILVKRRSTASGDLDGYMAGAFKWNNVSNLYCVVIFADEQTYNEAQKRDHGLSYVNDNFTYPMTVYFYDGTAKIDTQEKLFQQSIQYTKDEQTGFWEADTNYELPKVNDRSVTWYMNGKQLTKNTLVTTNLATTISVSVFLGYQLQYSEEDTAPVSTLKFTSGKTKTLTLSYDTAEEYASLQDFILTAVCTSTTQSSYQDIYFEYKWIDSTGKRSGDAFSKYKENNPLSVKGILNNRTGNNCYYLSVRGYVKLSEKSAPVEFYRSSDTEFAVRTNIVVPITITPADITVYTGGEGYTGVVDDAGNQTTTDNGLPEPGFYITLPDELNEELGGKDHAVDLSDSLTISYSNNGTLRTWELELYGTAAHSTDIDGVKTARYIYRILPGVDENNQEIPIRLQIKDPDNSNQVITSDEFTPSLGEQYQEYEMSIYPGTLDPSKITASVTLSNGHTVTCSVNSGSGNLVVRGLTDGNMTAELVTEESQVSADSISAMAPSGATYYVNDSNVELEDTEGVRLLVDDVLDDGVLAKYIQEKMADDIPAGNYTYAQQYLDLVDTKNGNAYLTMGNGQKLTVYWPVPDDFDSSKNFYLVHFDGLDRNYENIDQALAENTPDIQKGAQLKNINSTQYIIFETDSFSPFVLVYEKESGGGGDSGGTHYSYTLRYDTNGGEAIRAETKSFSWTKIFEELPVPVRDGYTFDGWYFDSKLTDLVEDDVIVNRSTVTIYAGWRKNTTDPDTNGVSDWLNTGDHNAYLSGYGDGTFGPDNNMTRAEVAQMFYNLLLDKDVAITMNFHDVQADAWYADAVNTLASLGMISGVGNNQFEPERSITRAEFTTIAMRFTNGILEGENTFPDVNPGDWFYDYVVGSIQYGWISGYPDGTFGPNDPITRAEVTTIANRMLGRSADKAFVNIHAASLRQFTDLANTHWAYYDIMEAANSHNYSKSNRVESWIDLKTE